MQHSTNELTTECISRADYFEKFRGFENQFQSPFKDVTTPNSMRNRITGQLLKAFLNHKIKDFGKMTTLHIDTQEKHISLTANLLGETEPIDASLKYTLQESDGRTFFVPTELNCSRHWLSLLAQQMLKDNVIRFEIPSGIAATMVKVLKI